MKMNTIFIFAFLILVSTNCKKNSDSGNDYASKVVGTYGGAVPPGVLSGKIVVSKMSNNTVIIDYNGWNGIPNHYENATVTEVGNGKYHVSATNDTITVSAEADSNIFDCNFNQIRFYGVKL
jgi:hypothetical protein